MNKSTSLIWKADQLLVNMEKHLSFGIFASLKHYKACGRTRNRGSHSRLPSSRNQLRSSARRSTQGTGCPLVSPWNRMRNV